MTEKGQGFYRRKRKGQSLVEFAMVAPIFFVFLFAILDFGRLFFTQMTMQHALREAGRFAVTGRHLPDGNGGRLSRVDSIIQIAQKHAVGLPLDAGDIQISSKTGGVGSAGGPVDTLTITLTYDMPLITPIVGQFFNNGTYTFTVGTTFKNEPFPTSQTN